MNRHLTILPLVFVFATLPASAILDTNGNGLSDLWEAQYKVGVHVSANLDPAVDDDGDGWTNAKEAAAGTDPFDLNAPDGYLRPETTRVPEHWEDTNGDGIPEFVPDSITLVFVGTPGKQYTLLSSTNLAEQSWFQVGDPFISNGNEITYCVFVTDLEKSLWRVAVTDADTDGDGLTDAEESVLGTNPANSHTIAGIDDLWLAKHFTNILLTGGPAAIVPNADPDGDGLTNAQEAHLGTNPNLADTDGDGSSDGDEVKSGHDPKSNQSYPPMWVHTQRHSFHGLGYISSSRDWGGTVYHDWSSISAPEKCASLLATDCLFPDQPPDNNSHFAYDDGFAPLLVDSSGDRPHPGYRTHLTQSRFWLKTKPAPDADLRIRLLRITNRKVIETDLSETIFTPEFEPLDVIIRADEIFSDPIDALPTFTQVLENGKIEHVVTTLIRVDVGVDNNRDGNLDLSASDDRTTAEKPYRFWLNNDHDNYGNDTYNAEDDHPWTTESLDNADTRIESERDLEDLARLHLNINGLQSQLEAGTLTLGLKWKITLAGTPKIRLFKAVETDGGTKYLSDAVQAAAQMADGRDELGVVQGAAVCDLPVSFWTSTSAKATKHLLFEGLGEGKGELTLVVKKGATVIGESGSVFLDLLDIRKMYERWKVSDTAVIDDPNKDAVATVSGVIPVADPYGHPFQPAWDEDLNDKQYVICVHGWRKGYYKARSDEITMFKRLWHRGFKGRYIGFKWPTYDETGWTEFQAAINSKYNQSEFRAWKCGEAFKALVSGLPLSYKKKAFAHSLGNVVVGSALEKGMNVDYYALSNAAIPAFCYDASAPRRVGTVFTPPDFADDTNSAVRALSYRGDVATVGNARLENVSPTAVFTNLYLKTDTALVGAWSWEHNQWECKEVSGYDYEPGTATEWDPVGFGYRVLTDPHEAMAMVNRSVTQAVGANELHGRINSNVNMAGPGMAFEVAGKGEHEAEFKWRYHRTWVFYEKLWTALKLGKISN